MKDRIKEAYEDYAIPSACQADIQETMQVSKQIVQALPTQKYVQKESCQIVNILRYHTPKILIAQVVTCCFFIMYAHTWVIVGSDNLQHSFFMMLFTSFVCMVSTSSEVIRSQIMGMWEMEKVCKVSPQRIMIYKTMMFGTISTLLILLSSFIYADVYHFSAGTLFLYGYLPFLFLTAVILQFSMHVETREALMGIYIICACMLAFGGTILLECMQNNMWLFGSISIVGFLFTYVQYYQKSAKSFISSYSSYL